jgi:hypothetical protein
MGELITRDAPLRWLSRNILALQRKENRWIVWQTAAGVFFSIQAMADMVSRL